MSLKFKRFFIMALLLVLLIGIKKIGWGIVYQPTPSMPIGFYVVFPAKQFQRNDTVVFQPPEAFRQFLRIHHWAPDNGYLMKYVVGVPEDFVCNRYGILTVNDKKIANLYRFYEKSRPLPKKNFCQRLKKDQYLLMNPKVPRSFDGRYFGPINQKAILGKAWKIDREYHHDKRG